MASGDSVQFAKFTYEEEIKLISGAQNRFSKDLFLEISKNAQGNVFISPFSIAVILAMTHFGSKNKTEEQMRNCLYLPSDLNKIQNAHKELLTDYKTPSSEYDLNTSNRIYVSHDRPILESYITALTNAFLAEVSNVDFGNDETRLNINQKVEEDTNKRISELIKPGILNKATQLVLVNAVYFKGLWKNKFEKSKTTEKPFWISESSSVPVQMMSIKEKFRMESREDLDATLLAMDYKGDRLSFVIILPNKREGLAQLEEKLQSFDFTSLDIKTRPKEIYVSLPKFKMEESLDLGTILGKLGMSDLFEPNLCDLSGITGEKDLFVSKVLHKAFVEINEEGSEAAAATAMIMMRCAMIMSDPIVFTADHPFIFSIRDQTSGMLLFLGKYTTP